MNLREVVAGSPGLRRLATALAPMVVRRVRGGRARGLRFDAAGANFDYLLGTNELTVQNALVDLIRPGNVVLDVGANVGFFTMIAARATGPSGIVLAFEPVADNADALEANARRNRFDHVRTHRIALADRTGEAEIILTDHPGGATLASAGLRPPDARGRAEVPVARFDDLRDQHAVPAPDVIKIDVEGAEVQVLRGMEHTLRVDQPRLLIEVDDADPEGCAQRLDEVVAFLSGCGYHYRLLAPAYPDAADRVRHIVAEHRA